MWVDCSCAQEFQSKELPNTRIQPDRRWFGNTRVIGQKQLEQFRDEMSAKVRMTGRLLACGELLSHAQIISTAGIHSIRVCIHQQTQGSVIPLDSMWYCF